MSSQNNNHSTKRALGQRNSGGKILQGQFYKTRMCPYLNRQGLGCKRRNNCCYAHNENELLKTVDLTKTKLCVGWEEGRCDRDPCPFAHGLEELRSTNQCFKTQQCRKFNATGTCQSGNFCRHAHGEEEAALVSELRREGKLSPQIQVLHFEEFLKTLDRELPASARCTSMDVKSGPDQTSDCINFSSPSGLGHDVEFQRQFSFFDDPSLYNRNNIPLGNIPSAPVIDSAHKQMMFTLPQDGVGSLAGNISEMEHLKRHPFGVPVAGGEYGGEENYTQALNMDGGAIEDYSSDIENFRDVHQRYSTQVPPKRYHPHSIDHGIQTGIEQTSMVQPMYHPTMSFDGPASGMSLMRLGTGEQSLLGRSDSFFSGQPSVSMEFEQSIASNLGDHSYMRSCSRGFEFGPQSVMTNDFFDLGGPIQPVFTRESIHNSMLSQQSSQRHVPIVRSRSIRSRPRVMGSLLSSEQTTPASSADRRST
eukprot:GHVH01003562.1.p1 GENE.GHVH01003562.1~~GHVH01003562.1.p1  ORF type:complete len:477 (-),score=37.76 GHVH01003562.1:17-1447(-)